MLLFSPKLKIVNENCVKIYSMLCKNVQFTTNLVGQLIILCKITAYYTVHRLHGRRKIFRTKDSSISSSEPSSSLSSSSSLILPYPVETKKKKEKSNILSENSETRELRTSCSHSYVYTSNHEVSLDSLYQSQGVNFDRPTLPLLDIGAVWVSLQLALQLMGVKELKGL